MLISFTDATMGARKVSMRSNHSRRQRIVNFTGSLDSPLEQGGFEPPVPRATRHLRTPFFASPDSVLRVQQKGRDPEWSWHAGNVRRHLPVKGAHYDQGWVKGKLLTSKLCNSSDCSLYQRKISVFVVPNQYIAQRPSQCRNRW